MDKVGAKMLDLFRTYWAAMERLEVSSVAHHATRSRNSHSPAGRCDAGYVCEMLPCLEL